MAALDKRRDNNGNDLTVMDAVGQRMKEKGLVSSENNFIKTDLVPYDPGKLPVVRVNGDRGGGPSIGAAVASCL